MMEVRNAKMKTKLDNLKVNETICSWAEYLIATQNKRLKIKYLLKSLDFDFSVQMDLFQRSC